MTNGSRRRVLVAALFCLMVSGCGRGLGVTLSADPDPADPGDSVTWQVSVRNQSACETTGQTSDLPPPFPDTPGAFAIIFGFVPDIDELGAREICQLFLSGSEVCRDEECFFAHVEEGLGPDLTRTLRVTARAALGQSQPAGACTTVQNGSSGFAAICAFDPLAPGGTDTATHTDTAPDTGSRDAAQLAVAFAYAEGDDCRPGTEIAGGLWTLAGCFPASVAQPAPVMSPWVMIAAALLILAGGIAALRRRRS